MRGMVVPLVVPLDVMLANERALTPGLVARVLAFVFVDALDVDHRVQFRVTRAGYGRGYGIYNLNHFTSLDRGFGESD